jgi:hypothetical protein
MPKAYSGDLRVRVIEMVRAGASRREAAEAFSLVLRRCEGIGVTVRTLRKCLARRQLSVFLFRVRVAKPRHLTMPRQMPLARRRMLESATSGERG